MNKNKKANDYSWIDINDAFLGKRSFRVLTDDQVSFN